MAQALLNTCSAGVKILGFPRNGSFSMKQIQQLEEKLKNERIKVKKQKKIRKKDLELCDSHEECFNMWKEEVKKWNKKSEKLSSPLYPFSSLLRVDSDLDAYPHPRRAQPPDVPPPADQLLPVQQQLQNLAVGPLPQNQLPPPPIEQPPPLYSIQGLDTLDRDPLQAPAPFPQVNPFYLSSPLGQSVSSSAPGTPQQSGWVSPIRLATAFPHVSGYYLRKGNRPDSGKQEEAHVHHLPMVQVAGPDGVQLVHRPWTHDDMVKALAHLPEVKASGLKFSNELFTFCKEFSPTTAELKRLLMKKLGPADYAKIKHALGEDDHRQVHLQWDHGDNHDYRAIIEAVRAEIGGVFNKMMLRDASGVAVLDTWPEAV